MAKLCEICGIDAVGFVPCEEGYVWRADLCEAGVLVAVDFGGVEEEGAVCAAPVHGLLSEE